MGQQRKPPQAPGHPWTGLLPSSVGPPTGVPDGTGTPWDAAERARRFRGMDWLMRVDAVPDARLDGVTFHDDRGVLILASSRVTSREGELRAFVHERVPLSLRVGWRQSGRYVLAQAAWVNDGVIGDHTVPVAARLPEALLDDLRAKPGTLRLKFRLTPEGVLFAWDVERHRRGNVRHDDPGGDFVEARR